VWVNKDIRAIAKCYITKKILDAKSIGEDDQDEMFSNEAREEDSKIVTSKEQRREHKWEYQWKYRLQQAWLLIKGESQQWIKKRSFLQHIDEALSILISDVVRKAHRSIANVVRTLAMFITDFLKGYDVIM